MSAYDPETESVRERLLRLAAECEAAPDDDAALAIVRHATGLTITDPERDRAILADRMAAEEAGEAIAAGGRGQPAIAAD